jgi:hypothetical protein
MDRKRIIVVGRCLVGGIGRGRGEVGCIWSVCWLRGMLLMRSFSMFYLDCRVAWHAGLTIWSLVLSFHLAF